RVVGDAIETLVDIAELLPDALDEGADIDAKAFLAIAGDEILAANEIVDLAIRHVGIGGADEQPDDIELGQRQVDAPPVIVGTADVSAQLKPAARQRLAEVAALTGRRCLPAAFRDHTQAPQDDAKAARLVDEIDGTPAQRLLLVVLVAQHRQEDDRD